MIYRTEHPKPQFRRDGWRNLNGLWAFEIDRADSGEERGYFAPDAPLSREINVPFCPESRLSGIADRDFMAAVWYRRSFTLTETEAAGRVVLHFGAVDYLATVAVNGTICGTHKGGYVSFSFDITELVHAGENVVTVRAQDNSRNPLIPHGKQSGRYASYGCYYTRTTGIWQTVWLEFTPKAYLASARYETNRDPALLTISAQVVGTGTLTAAAFFEGAAMGTAQAYTTGGNVVLAVPLAEAHLWELGKGGLYDLELTFGEDRVHSYFGLRTIQYQDRRFLLNGRPVFQRTVLDQGFYPEGIYTAPSDEELEADIDRSMAMGFHGARLHEKVFEERFLYHCDRKGYLVWGEFPNWGLDHSRPESVYGMLPEWLEEIRRDRNHPAIIGWCPFNETWDVDGRKQHDDLLALVYHATKAADPSRPCIDVSGNFHVVTDVYDIHDYVQDPEEFARRYAGLAVDGTISGPQAFPDRQRYDGKAPFFLSEFGGIRWTDDQGGWGYGDAPATREEFLARLKGLVDALMDNPGVMGLCYTQLTDVEQEQNGLYTYDRRPKFPPEEIAAIFSRPAAIEADA